MVEAVKLLHIHQPLSVPDNPIMLPSLSVFELFDAFSRRLQAMYTSFLGSSSGSASTGRLVSQMLTRCAGR